MQPFDALTLKAILQELRPVITKSKIDRIFQIGRDEIIFSLRSKSGAQNLLISAHPAYGRICLTKKQLPSKQTSQPNFCLQLRKHLSGAVITDINGSAGERFADLILACHDEVGSQSTKVLTIEIMSRHSNLIFWDKNTNKILAASHTVSESMSRQRQLFPGLTYIRPPSNDKANIFAIKKEDFIAKFKPEDSISLESWLLSTFSGLGRHLAEEITLASQPPSAEIVWKNIQTAVNTLDFKPSMCLDLTSYSVLSLAKTDDTDEWTEYSSVNDMVDEYYESLQERAQIQQLKDRIKAELNSQKNKIETSKQAAIKQLDSTIDLELHKRSGDLILANLQQIHSGQSLLTCEDLYNSNQQISIDLNPNLTATQNAQNYYRFFAKGRTKKKIAEANIANADEKIQMLESKLDMLNSIDSLFEAERLQEEILGFKQKKSLPQKPQQQTKSKNKAPNLLNTKSSDGFLMYVGRNRLENDLLVSKIAKPSDLWMHVKDQHGSHVIIKLPNKEDPPLSTIKEAAELAARFSNTGLGSKITVIYTYVKHVRKVGGDKPGLVTYTNEKSIVVDTRNAMPKALQKLFK